jgi:hypothetical protein
MVLKDLEVKTIIQNRDNPSIVTAYFYDPLDSVILPVNLRPSCLPFLIGKGPRLENLFLKGLEISGLKTKHIWLGKGPKAEILVCSSNLKVGKIKCSLEEAIILNKHKNITIKSSDEFIKRNGIKLSEAFVTASSYEY